MNNALVMTRIVMKRTTTYVTNHDELDINSPLEIDLEGLELDKEIDIYSFFYMENDTGKDETGTLREILEGKRNCMKEYEHKKLIELEIVQCLDKSPYIGKADQLRAYVNLYYK